MTNQPKPQRGGKRQGAGRKARFGARMTQKTVRLPAEYIDRLIAEYGSFQAAIEALAQTHLDIQDAVSSAAKTYIAESYLNNE